MAATGVQVIKKEGPSLEEGKPYKAARTTFHWDKKWKRTSSHSLPETNLVLGLGNYKYDHLIILKPFHHQE